MGRRVNHERGGFAIHAIMTAQTDLIDCAAISIRTCRVVLRC
jgi:hypothetical protein